MNESTQPHLRNLGEMVQSRFHCDEKVAAKILEGRFRSLGLRLLGALISCWVSAATKNGCLQEYSAETRDLAAAKSVEELESTWRYWNRRGPHTGLLSWAYQIRLNRAAKVFHAHLRISGSH